MNLPLGYRYAATYAGIRKTQQNDLALIVSELPAQAAAVFTTNRVQAAPVKLARKHLKSSNGRVSAIVVNAGNANCATRTGDKVALATTKAIAQALKTKTEYVLPASTGVIGVELDPKLITGAIPALLNSFTPDGFEMVAEAILTTDTRKKVAFETVVLDAGAVRVAGMTKGAGMIHPNMATTLAFVMTDAAVPARGLRSVLAAGVQDSFNSLSVDGDMSTNDTLALLANGASEVRVGSRELPRFQQAVTAVLQSLAKQIAADGEGARKLIVIHVQGFRSDAEARQIARSIANSPLVKTAIAGSDPNWGRILSSAGYAGVTFEPTDIDVFLQGVKVCQRGLAAPFCETDLKSKLDASEVQIRVVQRGRRKGQSKFFTCDFTEGYIRINGSYRT